MSIFILLMLVHFLGDFIFQPSSWVKSKFEKGVFSSGFIKHILTHAILLSIIGIILKSFWIPLMIIFLSHVVIDVVKIIFLKTDDNQKYRMSAFILDQFSHLLIIFIIVLNTSLDFDWAIFLRADILLLIFGYLFLTNPTSAFIRELLLPYTKEIETKQKHSTKSLEDEEFYKNKAGDFQKSLKNGGHYIGILERILVFTFIIIGQWGAVGFLITAKSVFRFGDLNHGKNRQFTEYVLIGTLLSFGFAIFAALTVEYLKGYL